MNAMEFEMNSYEFKKSFSKQWFTKDLNKDFQIAYSLCVFDRFSMTHREKGFTIEPYLDIINKPIENFYMKVTTRKLIKLGDLRTIGNRVADIIANTNEEYNVRSKELNIFLLGEEDINNAANILINYFKTVALPYFEKNANWQALDRIFNSNISKSSVHVNVEADKGIRGLIVAKILGRKDIVACKSSA